MRADAQQNREHLLDAARVLMSGDRTPTLNELARHTGLGVATVYRHFPDADALATALMERPLAQLRALCEQASAEPDAFAAVRALVHGVLDLVLANPVVARLIYAPETTSEPVQRVMEEMRTAAQQLMARARRARAVRASITGEDICHLLLGIHAAALAAGDSRAAGRRYAEIVLAGLAPSPRKHSR